MLSAAKAIYSKSNLRSISLCNKQKTIKSWGVLISYPPLKLKKQCNLPTKKLHRQPNKSFITQPKHGQKTLHSIEEFVGKGGIRDYLHIQINESNNLTIYNVAFSEWRKVLGKKKTLSLVKCFWKHMSSRNFLLK